MKYWIMLAIITMLPTTITALETHELSDLELQEQLITLAQEPQFDAIVKFLNTRGLVLQFNEMSGGQISGESPTSLFAIPFSHPSGNFTGYLGVSNNLWRILILPQIMNGEFEIEEYEIITTNRGTRFERISTIDDTKSLPIGISEMAISPSLNEAWSPLTCVYVENIYLNIGCWLLPDNPFGYGYTVRVRSGYWWDEQPTSYSWWACTWGSAHVCPVIETSTYTFPYCGFAPSHPSG
jgi:hypothetical protein